MRKVLCDFVALNSARYDARQWLRNRQDVQRVYVVWHKDLGLYARPSFMVENDEYVVEQWEAPYGKPEKVK